MSKFSVAPVVSDHLKTLRDDRTHRPRWWPDIAVLHGLPLGFATLSLGNGFRLQGIGEVLGGLAILGGFLFALVIFVFQLRISITNDPRISSTAMLPRLIDELFANVSYAVLVGLTTTAVAMAAASTRSADPKNGNLMAINPWWSAALILLFAHLMLLLGMALRRTRVAYGELRR